MQTANGTGIKYMSQLLGGGAGIKTKHPNRHSAVLSMNNALKIWEQTLLGTTNILHLRVRIFPDDSSENSTYYSCIEGEECDKITTRFRGSAQTKASGVDQWLVIRGE